jgi:hypothetical protein
MNLQLNDPTLPPPGEMVNESTVNTYRTTSPLSMMGLPTIGNVDPHHYRTPSLGEIHQELEQEQEAQVVCHPFLWICGQLYFVSYWHGRVNMGLALGSHGLEAV